MLSADLAEMKSRASQWAEDLREKLPGLSAAVEETTSYVGGGVAPMKGIPSCAVSISSSSMSAAQLAGKLRQADPPIITRIEENRVYFEMRTLLEGDLEKITAVLLKVLSF
jgi:L-seryl-tRNA(Ser) seleniumtransferase